tara:strand:- start:55304 stop:59338 length:4035 start_codon:yes stop_codon:yes gene_type:complete
MPKKENENISAQTTGGSLQVPIALDAIRVDNKGNYSSVNSVKTSPATTANTVADFSKMGDNGGLGGLIAPEILTGGSGSKPKPGVHLHWTVPKAIANSTPVGNGGLKHPDAPDRWFVLRYEVLTSGKSIPSKAWIVISNSTEKYTNTNPDNKTIWPTFPPDEQSPFQVMIGDQLDYTNTLNPKANNPINLVAVGPGDPTMAANHQASKSVFGLYDDLSDYPSNTLVEFTYLTIGWYDKPKNDILYIDPNRVTAKQTIADLWVDLMKNLHWTWDPDPSPSTQPLLPNPLPNISIYHGLLYGLQWEGPNPTNGYASGAPDDFRTISISMGRTSVEALSALIAKKFANASYPQKEIEEVLEALQYSFLDKYNNTDGPAEVDATNHQNGYEVKNGGLVWDIRPKTSSQLTPLNGDTQQKLPPIPAYYGKALGELNLQQVLVNQLRQELIATQQELYNSWYKKNLYYLNYSQTPTSFTNEFNTIKKKLETLSETTLPTVEKQLNALRTALTASVDSKLKDYELHEVYLDRFWAPNDPVIMMNGLVRPEKYGGLGALFCRPSVLYPPIKGINFTDNGAPKSVNVTQLASLWKFNLGKNVPQEVNSLIFESFFLTATTTMATAIAQLAGINNPGENLINAINAIQNGTAPANKQKELIGVFPIPISRIIWSQAWNPLFLQWEMKWYSSYTAPDSNNPLPKNVLAQSWDFLGDTDGMDYSWTKATPPNIATTYRGQSILGAHASYNLAAQLKKYIDQNSHNDSISPINKYPFIQKILDAILKWDLLSQKLTGFNNQLFLTDPNIILPLYNTSSYTLDSATAQLIGNAQKLIPQSDSGNPFLPVMAGHLQISKLMVVDTFGQVQPIVDVEKGINKALQPILPNNLVTKGFPGYAQFAPRIPQPARIKFRWLAAEVNDLTPITTNAVSSTSPICGWVVPNHLDGSLMIFNAKGGAQGAIQFIAGGAGTDNAGIEGLRWNAVPGSNAPLGSGPQLKNIYLQGFVEALLKNGLENNTSAALQDIFNYLNESMEQVDPTGQRRSNNLSVLIGEPLALVRANIQLEAESAISEDPSFKVVDKFETYNYENVIFPAALGAKTLETDSLLGYFIGTPDPLNPSNVFKQMSLPYGEKASINSSSYLKQNKTIPLTLNKAADSVELTILTRPHGTVYIRTGHLPVKKVVVPQEGIVEALAAMELSFFIGPVLTNSQQISIPLPADVPGSWSWEMQEEITQWQTTEKIAGANVKGHFFKQPLQINEGYLNLNNALGDSLSILYFQVQNGQYLVKANTTVNLIWQVQGAVEIKLTGGFINKSWNTSPLHTNYSVKINTDVTYTLTILDKNEKTVSKTLSINLIK